MLASISAQGYAGCCAALRETDLREEIASIGSPTLVISAASDPATPPADGQAIQARIPGSMMVLLEASHLANVERPDAFTRAVVDFIPRTTRS